MKKQKQDVLLLCQFFYPEYNSSATLPWDTAKFLTDSGLSVGALCGYPKEYNNMGAVPETEIKDGVRIRRLHYLQLKRGRKLARIINYLSFTAAVLFHLRTVKPYKTLLVYSNPPVLPAAAILANRLFGTRIVFVSYDVYPEVAYASGTLTKDGLVTRVMTGINRRLFPRLSAAVALTEEMKEFLVENRPGLDPEKVQVIPNWAHESFRVPEHPKEVLERFEIQDGDLVVSYFGNMGVCQDVETMLTAMEQLKDHKTIRFLIAGHGGKKEMVLRRSRDLPNVRVLDFLTGEDFEQALWLSSVGIVSLEAGLRGTCAPSKFYSYLQSGTPVIAVTEEDSYLAKEVVEEDVGLSVALGDGERLARILLELERNPERRLKMAEKAKDLYQRAYAKDKCLSQYRDLVGKVRDSANEN